MQQLGITWERGERRAVAAALVNPADFLRWFAVVRPARVELVTDAASLVSGLLAATAGRGRIAWLDLGAAAGRECIAFGDEAITGQTVAAALGELQGLRGWFHPDGLVHVAGWDALWSKQLLRALADVWNVTVVGVGVGLGRRDGGRGGRLTVAWPGGRPRRVAGLRSGVGAANGTGVGRMNGTGIGRMIGNGIGAANGTGIGRMTGAGIGRMTGRGVGAANGTGLGRANGSGVGAATGSGVGRATGRGVGRSNR